MQCRVLVSSRSPGIGEGLTYETGTLNLKPGAHVRVPLRKRTVDGVVIAVQKARTEKSAKADFAVKEVTALLGDRPLLTEAQLQTLQWMADHYCCTLRQALQAFLPSPPWTALLPLRTKHYSMMKSSEVRGEMQKCVLEFLSQREWCSEKELREETGASLATLKNLSLKGILRVTEQEEGTVKGGTLNAAVPTLHRPTLTPTQKRIAKEIAADPRPSLLFGITGSGKTEVYASLIADTIASGQRAILLVPEILLTEHSITRFLHLLDRDHIAIIHSRLTPAKRREAWRRIHRGDAHLVIGSRSALFSPFSNLGLVIIDEEHEWTYKNEQAPRYHARETAEKLCKFSSAKLVLGTATPSLETWAKGLSKTYHVSRLPKRYGDHPLPSVRIIDLGDVDFGDHYPFSTPLFEAIETRLKRGEQSVLFLNRRGIATALLCLDCRRRVISKDSLLPLTVHRKADGTPYLVDHTTGVVSDLPTACPHCQSSRLFAVGAGTQRIEEILTKSFPQARIARADSDTLLHPEHMRLLLEKMQDGRIDILLGTQSVVKGLDIPGVTLAAVLLADVGLSLPHFRAGERIFQLLTQLTGRSGRAQPGDVIIQTFRPEAPEVKLASEHKTEEYLTQELKLRIHAGYPPATAIVRLLVRSENPASHAKNLKRTLEAESTKRSLDLRVAASPTFGSGGRVWQVIVRGAHPKAILEGLELEDVAVDVDPIECI